MGFTWLEQTGKRLSDRVLSIDKKYFRGVLIVLIVCEVVLWGYGSVLQKIHFGDISGIYDTYEEFRAYIPPAVKAVIKHLRIPLLIPLIVDFVFLVWKRKYILISICSFSPDLVKADVKKKNRRISRKQLNLCDEMQKLNVTEAVAKADSFIANIQKHRGNAELGIYGIMHTPLLFRIGYDLGDQNNVDLYHKKRTNDSSFEEWKQCTARYKIKTEEKNKGIKSDEMIVAVSTSLEITRSEISCLSPESKHILSFTGSVLDFDAIMNYPDAAAIRDIIMREIREKSKKYDIRKIHMVISSSVAFTIFLGMSYSKQHDPECIVYHYVQPGYPWGISICSPAEDCFVRNESQAEV